MVLGTHVSTYVVGSSSLCSQGPTTMPSNTSPYIRPQKDLEIWQESIANFVIGPIKQSSHSGITRKHVEKNYIPETLMGELPHPHQQSDGA